MSRAKYDVKFVLSYSHYSSIQRLSHQTQAWCDFVWVTDSETDNKEVSLVDMFRKITQSFRSCCTSQRSPVSGFYKCLPLGIHWISWNRRVPLIHQNSRFQIMSCNLKISHMNINRLAVSFNHVLNTYCRISQ